MANKFISYGSADEAFIYDDAETYADLVTHHALRTDGQLYVEQTATDPNHVVRFGDASNVGFWEEDGNGDLMPKA